MTRDAIKKQIEKYQHKLDRVDAWASLRKKKYIDKIKSLKEKLHE